MTNMTDTNDQMDRVDGFRLEAEPEVPPVPACVELGEAAEDAAGGGGVRGDGETGRDRIDMSDRIDKLRLWLPAVHTLSQNRTKGRHWSQSYRARKGEAAALLDALSMVPDEAWPGAAMLAEACRVLGLLALGQDARKIRKPSFTRPAGSPRLVIAYTRVTTRPLDAENWCGSTKGMTDCLKYALPGLLPDDAPEFVEIVHRQVKCAKRCEEGMWVELRLG